MFRSQKESSEKDPGEAIISSAGLLGRQVIAGQHRAELACGEAMLHSRQS